MAKITTITNPLTGQPAQVDQLEHTAQQIDDAISRALPGGAIDTALQNKAPAGFGLGLSGPPATDDCNTATKNGWYHVYGGTLNKPFGQVGALLVACRASSQMYQLFFVGETYGTGGSCIIVRSMYGGEWGPWEWVSPPMELGVEYRTTERYQGKPVHKKRFTTNALPNNAQLIQENVINASTDSLFDLHITFVNTADGSVSSYPPFYGTNIAARAWVRGTGELVITTFTDL